MPLTVLKLILQKLEIFLECFATIMVNNAGVYRIIYPLLCTLEQILSAQLLECFEEDPDSSPSLKKIVDGVAIVCVHVPHHLILPVIVLYCHDGSGFLSCLV